MVQHILVFEKVVKTGLASFGNHARALFSSEKKIRFRYCSTFVFI